jgi:hypothetical protein
LKGIDELVKHAFDQLDLTIGPLKVNRRPTEAHRDAELRFERA